MQRQGEAKKFFSLADGDRVRGALLLGRILVPLPKDPTPDQLQEVMDSLYKDTYTKPIELKKWILPPQTQRILDNYSFCSPKTIELSGGLSADPLLPLLLDRHYHRFSRRLLPPPGTPLSLVDKETAGRTCLFLNNRDVLMCHFLNFVISPTRDRPSKQVDQTVRISSGERSPLITGGRVLEPPLSHRTLPLSFHSIDDLTIARVYNDLAYEYITNVYLPTHRPFGDAAHPDATLFLSAVVSYWLMQNAPFLTPLPGQSYDSASPLPLSEAQKRDIAAFVLEIAKKNTAARIDAAGSTLALENGPSNAAGGAKTAAATTANIPRTPSPLEYIAPTYGLLEVLTIFLTMQMCDADFPQVVDGVDGKTHGTGGPRVLELALDGLDRDPYVRPSAFAELLRDLRRCPHIAGEAISRLDPKKIRADIPGMVQMPEVVGRIQAPLFHFFRNHLSRLSMTTDPQLFVSAVDLWTVILTPWRARPRYKGKLPNYHSKILPARRFGYNETASSLLQETVNKVRRDPKNRNNFPGTRYYCGCFRTRRLAKVDLLDMSAKEEKNVPFLRVNDSTGLTDVNASNFLPDLMNQVRTQGDYDALFSSTSDFKGGLIDADLFTDGQAGAPVSF